MTEIQYILIVLQCWWANLCLTARWKWHQARDSICMFIAWRLLPRRVVMWCAMRVGANATTGRWSTQLVPQLTFMEAVKRWEVE